VPHDATPVAEINNSAQTVQEPYVVGGHCSTPKVTVTTGATYRVLDLHRSAVYGLVQFGANGLSPEAAEHVQTLNGSAVAV